MAADETRATHEEVGARLGHCFAGLETDSHLVPVRCSAGWLTKRCQITAHSPSVWGVTRSENSGGMRTQALAARRVAPPSRPTMPKTGAPHLLRQLDRVDQVGRDVLLPIAAAHREDEKGVAFGEARSAEPLRKARVPSLVIDPRGELRHVVGRRVGLEAADLPEVVDGVARVARRAPDAEQKQAAA